MGSGKDSAQLSALSPLQDADCLPIRAAMVHSDGSVEG